MKYVECDVTEERCTEETSSVLKVSINEEWSIELDIADDALVSLGFNFPVFGGTGGQQESTLPESGQAVEDDDDDDDDEEDDDEDEEEADSAMIEEKLREVMISALRAEIERRR